MQYARKLGASALVVAAAFAVAFAVLISSTTSPPTVEAADIPIDDGTNAETAAPGDTVQFTINAELAQMSITGTADGVGASFDANDGQSISCADGTSCDADDLDNAAVEVHLNVDADAGEGYILVRINRLGISSPSEVTKVITVSKAGLVGSLELKADAASDKTIASTGTSNLTVTVENASTPPGGLEDQGITVITTHGTVGCGSGAGSASAGTTQTCQADTDAAGVVDVVLTGGGVEGIATVTATLGTRTSDATVTLFGNAKNLTAEPDQGSIEISGSSTSC